MADSKSYPKGSTPFRISDPIVLARALAADRINVKGTGQLERAKPGAAKEADRKPNWNKWRLIPNLAPWQCAALWANIDPDKLKFINDAWMAEGSIHRFHESQEFKDRLELVEANQYGALKSRSSGVELRLFAAWVREVQETGWPAPPELLAMADEQVAIKADKARSGKRTGPGTATLEARRADRLGELKRFIDDVYEAASQGDLNLVSGNVRKALPFSPRDLRAAFLERHPEHEIAQATFTDDLPQISVKVRRGPKRMTINYLRAMLAKKNKG